MGVFDDFEQVHQTVQLNLGSCVADDAGKSTHLLLLLETHDDIDDSLGKFMLFFGEIHRDSQDAVGQASTVIINSDYPENEGYDPGYFFILGFGVYVDLPRYRTFSFFGQHAHAGTSIRAPQDVAPPSWVTRVLMVHYSKDLTMNGLASYNLAPLKPKFNLFVTPEMILAKLVTAFAFCFVLFYSWLTHFQGVVQPHNGLRTQTMLPMAIF